jgi:hypothetical protein
MTKDQREANRKARDESFERLVKLLPEALAVLERNLSFGEPDIEGQAAIGILDLFAKYGDPVGLSEKLAEKILKGDSGLAS